MSLYDKVNAGGAKDDLIQGLTSGELSPHFEVIREYTGHTGGRNIASNTYATAFFLPCLIIGIISIGASFLILFSPDSEAPIWTSGCTLIAGSIATITGFSAVKASVGEVVDPDDYVKYEMTVFFNSRERYLAKIEVILDATDDNLIGDITIVDEIILSDKSEIKCEFHPGSDGGMTSDSHNYFVSLGNVSITIDHHGYLKDKEEIKIADEWSKRLGVKVGTPLFGY